MKFLFRHVLRHPAHYLILNSGLIVALILLFIFRFEPFIQRYVIYSTTGFYLVWGLFHHYRRDDLSLSVFLEYSIIALLAVLVATGQFF
jgi:hypothetical protein